MSEKTIAIMLDIHTYAEDKLCDEVLDDSPYYGIHGPEIGKPLSEKRNYEFNFVYSEQTTLKDVLDAVKTEVWGNSLSEYASYCKYAFTVGCERYYISDPTHQFEDILTKYLDINGFGRIVVTLLASYDAGTVDNDQELRYFVNSRERGRHHEAHIHIEDAGHHYSGSIRISDGALLCGDLPPKLVKKARRHILEKQDYFYHCWNTQTDGLKVDINHHFGLIQY